MRGTYQKRTLSDNLAEMIDFYEKSKDMSLEVKQSAGDQCLYWIEKAFTCGVVEEAPSLAKKLRECQEENDKLKKENSQLNEENIKLSTKYLTLEENYNNLKKMVGGDKFLRR